MLDRFLRSSEVQESLGVSQATIYRWMKAGHFPRPVRLGPATVAWKQSDLEKWLKERAEDSVQA